MKKTILLFLFVLPVIIVLLILAITGFVGRLVMVIPIQNAQIDSAIFAHYDGFHSQYSSNNLVLLAQVGDEFNIGQFVIIEPYNATSGITFESSNPNVVSVNGNGRIVVKQNMRSTDLATGVELVAMAGADRFFSVFVIVATDHTRFDYFGFEMELFMRGFDIDWISDFGLGVNFYNQIEFAKEFIAVEHGNIVPILEILERGLNVAPKNILNLANPRRSEFLESISLVSSDESILRIFGTAGQQQAELLAAGEVSVTITINFMGKNFSTDVPVVIV